MAMTNAEKQEAYRARNELVLRFYEKLTKIDRTVVRQFIMVYELMQKEDLYEDND